MILCIVFLLLHANRLPIDSIYSFFDVSSTKWRQTCVDFHFLTCFLLWTGIHHSNMRNTVPWIPRMFPSSQVACPCAFISWMKAICLLSGGEFMAELGYCVISICWFLFWIFELYIIYLICLISVDWEFFVSRSLEPAAKDASGTSSSYAYEQKPGKLRWLGTTMSRIHDGPVGWVERREISWKYCCGYRQWIQR